MFNNQTVNKDNDTRKIFTMLVMVFTLMICTTSATYAYFAIGATSVNTLTGTAATAELWWGPNDANTPTLVYPTEASGYSSGPLVPQKSLNNSTNVLQLAVTGGNPSGDGNTKVPCVDDNGNVVCRVYKFTICNNSTAKAVVNGAISFNYPEGSNFNNLKWLSMSSKDVTGTVSSTTIKSASTTAQNFANNKSLIADTANGATCAGGEATYYIAIWIEEMGYDQGINQTDTTKQDIGTFYATIEFTSANGTGVTSTITG